MFQTKDSGKRVEYTTGMVRDTNEGKARFDLIFPKGVPYNQQLLTRFAELMARGAQKYTERNWEKASTPDELERAMESALRHMIQWYNGETDEDHAAAVMFNLMAAEYIKNRMSNPADWFDPDVDDPAELGHRHTDTDLGSPVAHWMHEGDCPTVPPPVCETAGQHSCSKHPKGFPLVIETAYGQLR